MSELEQQIFLEVFKENPWVLVVSEFLKSPTGIGLISAIAFAIVAYGVSSLFKFKLELNFGGPEKAYNKGYLEGFKKAVEELSRNTSERRMPE